jgi:hypothetical protein
MPPAIAHLSLKCQSRGLVAPHNSGHGSEQRDERTGMIWSDIVAEASHCQAAGNSQNLGFDCSANTESLCAEVDGLRTPDKVGLRPAVYSDAKGGLGLVYSRDRSEGWIFFNTRSGNGGFYGAQRKLSSV